jgi:alpha-glucosidase (family GH31 glycosyl hydrolase)
VDGKTFRVVGNFGKSSVSYSIPAGKWTDYMTGNVVSGNVTLKQGEFRLITDF